MITRIDISRSTGLLFVLPFCLGGNCQSASDAPPHNPSLGALQTRNKAELNPEVIEQAEQILRQHPNAAIGSEFRFDIRGKRYIARIEQHENESSDPSRPPGKHNGVTVYED